MEFLLSLFLVTVFLSAASGKVSLYLSSDQTEALYGIKTPGLYYITEGVVNKYAMNFQHQVIPAEVDHIDFTWEAKKGSAVPYKITFIHAPSKAMDNPSVNISTEGIVPTHTDKFRLFFPCTGKVAEQVETLFQISFSIRRKSPEVLNFKRIKVCKLGESRSPISELVSDPLSSSDETDPVLLSSVSPSLFVILGAVSASIILLTVIMAGVYVRKVRKRGANIHGGESLRSSLHLSPDDEYLEKAHGGSHGGSGSRGSHCTVTMSSSDSYDTLASFTQVPVGRPEAPTWATINDYSTPVTKPTSSWRSGRSGVSLSCAASPRIMRHTPSIPQSSAASLHSVSRGWSGHELTPSRSNQRVRPQPQLAQYHHYQYSTVAQAAPGEASPYSVSSELYKHVLPGYYSQTSGGSVLV